MKKVWDSFDKELDDLCNKKKRLEEDGFKGFALDYQQKLINRHLNRLQKINDVFVLLQNKYGLDNSFLKTILLPQSKLFNLKHEEVIARFDFYTNLFTSKELFYQVIKADSIYHFQFYSIDGGIFNWKYKEESSNKLEFIKSFYGLEHNDAIEFIIDNIYYYNSRTDLIINKVKTYADLFNVSESVIKNNSVRYPESFTTSSERLKEKFNDYISTLCLSEKEVQDIVMKYPPFLMQTKSNIIMLNRVLNKQTTDIRSLVHHRPYIYNCISYDKKGYYGEFEHLDEIENTFNYIEEHIGVIEDVFSYNKKYLFALVKNKDDRYFLLNIGTKIDSINKEKLNGISHNMFDKWCILIFDVQSYKNRHINSKIVEIVDLLKSITNSNDEFTDATEFIEFLKNL